MTLRILLIIGIFSFVAISYLGSNSGNAIDNTEAADKPLKVGIARWVENDAYYENIAGFKESLESYGFFEGQNIQYIVEDPQADKSKQREIIQNFIDSDVDLIYSLTTPGTLIAQEMTSEIPIVFSIVTFPVGAGIIDSMESSGNNLVGTSNFVSTSKQIDLIIDISNPETIGFVHRLGEVNSKLQFDEMKLFANSKEINLIDISPSSLDDVHESVLSQIGSVDVLYTACDTLVQSGAEEIVITIGIKHEKPVFSCNKDGIQKGALAGNVADFKTIGYMAGSKAAIIFHGGNPSNLISEVQKGDHIFLNTDSAKKLNITIPTHIQNIVKETFGDFNEN